MPITHIHKITSTISKAIAYGSADKIESDVEKDDIADAIKYASNDKTGEVVFKTLTSYYGGLNPSKNGLDGITNGYRFENDCKELLEKYPRKRAVREGEKPALLFHLIQGFDGYIPPQIANQIGVELVKEFLPNYIAQISTHTNTENIHNHIIFCAVDLDGNRYNDCDKNKDLLRKISDKICEKYDIQILEDTRDYKPVHWVDENGKHHSFEPTQRKKDLIEERKKGNISKDDVSSYRNSDAYYNSEIKKQSQREIIKRDLDIYIPLADNYEHLLSLLRDNLNYSIKDKKKDGNYLEHIVFLNPNFSKGVRDNSIGDGVYYSRLNLEKVIAENVASRNKENEVDVSHGEREIEERQDVPFISSFYYSTLNLDDINENVRAKKKQDNTYEYINRGEPEKTVIRSAKRIEKSSKDILNSDGYKPWESDYILHHSDDGRIKDLFKMKDEHISFAKTRAQEIQERLDALHFIEQNNLYNYNRINVVMENFWASYNSSFENLNEVGNKLEKLRYITELPDMLDRVQKRIKDNSSDVNYVKNELEYDRTLVKKYTDYLNSKGLFDPQKMEKVKSDLAKWEEKYSELSMQLSEKKSKLFEYERSIEILKLSGKGEREEFADTWKDYESIRSKGKADEKENEKNKKKHDRTYNRNR